MISQTKFWERLTTPTGGRILTLAAKSSGEIFAGTNSGGVYLSTNDGVVWSNIGLFEEKITTLSILPNGKIFAGTSENGIFRSDDNGINWTSMNNGLPNLKISTMSIAPDGSIYTASEKCISLSSDEGKTWYPYNAGLTATYISKIAFHPNGHVYVSSDSGLFRSKDKGKTWECMIYTHDYPIRTIGIDSQGRIFITNTFGPWEKPVRYSTDEGSTWIVPVIMEAGAGDEMAEFIFTPQGDVYCGTSRMFFKSTDHGISWKYTYINTSDITCLTLDAHDHIFIGTKFSGLFRSTDSGDTWIEVNYQLNNIFARSLLVTKKQQFFLGTSGNGLYRNSNMGSYWYQLGVAPFSKYDTFNSIVMNTQGDLFTASKKIFRSADGENWTFVRQLGGDGSYCLTIDDRQRIYGASDRTFAISRSTDNGDTWSIIGNKLTSVRAVAVSRSNTLYAGTLDSGLYRSSDDGQHWDRLVLPKCRVNSLFIDKSGWIYTGTDLGIFRSNDSAVVWEQVNVGLLKMNAKCFLQDQLGKLYVGTNGGVCYSTNNGDQWISIVDGMLQKNINAFAFDSSGYLYAGTEGGGIYKSVYSTTPFPIAPIIQSTVDRASCQPVNVNLSWLPAQYAISYQIQVSADSMFVQSILIDSIITQQDSLSLSQLSTMTKYYWRVRSINKTGESSWSSISTFTTVPSILLSSQLDSPPDNATNQPIEILMRWVQPLCSDYYWLQVSTDSTFQTGMVFNDSSISINEKLVRLLSISKKYFWRVKAINSSIGQSPWSVIRSFTTEWITDVNAIERNAPEDYSLTQNFPNPFSSSTAITYHLSSRGHVRLEVFDMLGRKIATLVDEEKDKGEYTSKFEIHNSSAEGGFDTHPGVYFYRLCVGENVMMKKMIILE